MAIWNVIKDKAAIDRLKDEAIHAAAMKEITSGHRRDGLWTKAIIESNGDEHKAKIVYLRLLVIAIRDDMYLTRRAEDIISTMQSSPRSPKAKKSQHAGTSTTGNGLPANATQDELMHHYGITRDGSQYALNTYRFGEFRHALAHARHIESLKQGA